MTDSLFLFSFIRSRIAFEQVFFFLFFFLFTFKIFNCSLFSSLHFLLLWSFFCLLWKCLFFLGNKIKIYIILDFFLQIHLMFNVDKRWLFYGFLGASQNSFIEIVLVMLSGNCRQTKDLRHKSNFFLLSVCFVIKVCYLNLLFSLVIFLMF